MTNEPRLDPSALATLLHEVNEAWYTHNVVVAQPNGPDAAFIERFLTTRGVVAAKRTVGVTPRPSGESIYIG